jgi:hypothetical protein
LGRCGRLANSEAAPGDTAERQGHG